VPFNAFLMTVQFTCASVVEMIVISGDCSGFVDIIFSTQLNSNLLEMAARKLNIKILIAFF